MTRRPFRSSSRDRRGSAAPMFLYVLSFDRGFPWRRKPPRDDGPAGPAAPPRRPLRDISPLRLPPQRPAAEPARTSAINILEREDA